MSTYAHLVDAAVADGFAQPVGANEDQVTAVEGAFARLFGRAMPADYRAFLRTANGFMWDGVVLYGIVDAHDDGVFHPGLFDSNDRLVHGHESVETSLRFVGETGQQLFAHDTGDGSWKAVDRLDWQVASPDHVFSSFDALLTHALASLEHSGKAPR